MEVKDVRELKEELGKAIAEMIIKFEAETSCSVEYLDIIHGGPTTPWNVQVEPQIEI